MSRLDVANKFDIHIALRRHKDGENMPLHLIALGLAGETGEVLELLNQESDDEETRNAVLLELGDVLWYAVAALQELGTSLAYESELRASGPAVQGDLAVSVGRVCDIVKKDAWHGKPLSKRETIEAVYDIVVQVGLLAWWNQMSLNEVMEANIEKLNKRYPLDLGGFVEGGGIR